MISNDLATNYIKWADISVYLSDNDYQKDRYYTWTDQTKKTRLIYMVNEVMRWGQPYKINTQSYDEIATYLYSLIGQWLLSAATIANTGTGLVIGTPVIPTEAAGAAGQITIKVGDIGSPIAANATQYTNIILSNRVLIVILDNLVIQPSPLPSFDYSFNTVTGTITFSSPLSLAQILTIIYI
jgi:hypothetical protein